MEDDIFKCETLEQPYWELVEDGIIQGIDDNEYGDCNLAWSSEQRAREFKEYYDCPGQLIQLTYRKVKLEAMKAGVNLLLDWLPTSTRFEYVDIKKTLKLYPNEIAFYEGGNHV